MTDVVGSRTNGHKGESSAVNPDPDPGGKNDPQTKKKGDKFHFLKCWMFSFEV